MLTRPEGRCRAFGRTISKSGPWLAALILILADSGHTFDRDSVANHIREIRVGVAAHDVDSLWSGDSKEEGPDICAEIIFNRRLFHLLGAAAYPNTGISLNTRGDTSKIYGGFLLQWEQIASLTFSTGFGLALHNGERETDSADKKSLGAQVLFRVPIEIGYTLMPNHQITIAFDHISNAYLASPNDGMDTLGIFYGYRF